MTEVPRFLSVRNVLDIHADTLAAEGGLNGIRDVALLESAVAMPRSTYDGRYLHNGLADMAAAYLYHLCQNHALLDGNKRTAAFASILFLVTNGVPDEVLPQPEDLEKVTLDVASGLMEKSEVVAWFRQTIACHAPDVHATAVPHSSAED